MRSELENLDIILDLIPWNLFTKDDHDKYDMVLLLHIWDYPESFTEFDKVLENLKTSNKLFNPYEVVKWNINKIYLH